MNNIADIRKEYKLKSLHEDDVLGNPFEQFAKWWAEAEASNIDEINAMTLATVDADSHPSARIVLLKGFSEKGFHFFTNYESDKGLDIEHNNNVSLVFFWKELERQVRINGKANKLSDNDNDNYFFSRPKESQIGAWSSPQSKVIENRDVLENNVKNFTKKFESETLVRPPHWGGYEVNPTTIEFWQGRQSRLHDRIVYEKKETNWSKKRIAP